MISPMPGRWMIPRLSVRSSRRLLIAALVGYVAAVSAGIVVLMVFVLARGGVSFAGRLIHKLGGAW